ncbi:hypothetical protein D3C76_1125290 [compost metagenome]
MNQVSNHFGVGFRHEGITALSEYFTQRLVVFDDAVMHHHNVFRDMRVRVAFRRFTVGRPTGMGNACATVQRSFFRSLGQHVYFTEAAQTGHVPFCIDHCQTGRVVATVFQTT